MAGTITLYHYTTKKGKKGISKDRIINESKKPDDDGSDDARYGNGVYLTALSPSDGKIQLALNNWDGSADRANKYVKWGRVDCYVKIVLAVKDVKKIDDERDVYMYPGDLVFTEDMNVEFGDVVRR